MPMNADVDILTYVEDPGAANLITGLSEALARHGLVLGTFAPPVLSGYLSAHGLPHTVVDDTTTAPELLHRHSARILAVGTSENPDTFAFELVDAARQIGIPGVGLVDGPANAAWRFRGRTESPLAHLPDHLTVPDDASAEAFRVLGVPHGRIRVCGHPHHDRIREARCTLERVGRSALRKRVFPDIPKEERIVLFLAEISDGLDPTQFVRTPDYTLSGSGDSDKRTDIVLEEVLGALAEIDPVPSLIVRLHPKNRADEFDRYRRAIRGFSSGGIAWEAIFAADMVVGMTTVLMLEAALLGRPVLSVVPRESEKPWLPAIDAEIISCVTRRDELRETLRRAVDDPTILRATSAESLILYGAAENLASFLAELIGG